MFYRDCIDCPCFGVLGETKDQTPVWGCTHDICSCLISDIVQVRDIGEHDREVEKKMFREILLFFEQLKETSCSTGILDTFPFTEEREKVLDDLRQADWYLNRLKGFYRERFKEELGNA